MLDLGLTERSYTSMLDRDTSNNLLHIFSGIIVGVAIMFLLAPKPETKIQEVIKKRNDTIRVIDTVLKDKIKRIQALPETLVQVTFDTLFRDTGKSTGVTTTIYAERRCLEVTDSLAACMSKVAVDDVSIMQIDTLAKKKPPVEYKELGYGAIIGALFSGFLFYLIH